MGQEIVNQEIVKLGNFTCNSGKLIVSDPCYDLENFFGGELENVKTGIWNAQVLRRDEQEWGIRCAEIIAVHESVDNIDNVTWEECDFIVGVDSGQAGIFDAAVYKNDDTVLEKTTFDPDDKWYSLCCDKTLGEIRAGIINGGVVSSSGYGDGGYDAYILKDEDDIVAVKIVFISDEDEEEEDEFEDD